MNQPPRLMPAWFVYETVIPLESSDGWSRVEFRIDPRTDFYETRFVEGTNVHPVSKYSLGAFEHVGYWYVKIDPGKRDPTFAVVDPESRKTFMVTPYPERGLGRPITYSLPTDDLYTYPGEYVTNC